MEEMQLVLFEKNTLDFQEKSNIFTLSWLFRSIKFLKHGTSPKISLTNDITYFLATSSYKVSNAASQPYGSFGNSMTVYRWKYVDCYFDG